MTQRVIIDVREPEEYRQSHVTGALNITAAQLIDGARALDDMAKDSEIIVYCRSGSRSNTAINILRNMGFTNLTNGINQGQVEAKYG